MREHPKLRQTMNEQFGARGQLRVRQAIGEGNLLALEAATMQFCGTEAAAEAHLWLGDRALAAGDFLHAIGQYRQALEGNLPAGAVQPRLRLAGELDDVVSHLDCSCGHVLRRSRLFRLFLNDGLTGC